MHGLSAPTLSRSEPGCSHRAMTWHELSANEKAERAWVEYVALKNKSEMLQRSIAEAEARLPEWAQRGPGYLADDGTLKGKVLDWPVDLNIRPMKGMLVPVRLSHKTIRDMFEREVAAKPCARLALRAVYRQRMREFVARVRNQRALRERLGLPKLWAEKTRVDRRLAIVTERILFDLEPCPNSVAAILMTQGERCYYTLAHLKDFTTGQLNSAVEKFLADVDNAVFAH